MDAQRLRGTTASGNQGSSSSMSPLTTVPSPRSDPAQLPDLEFSAMSRASSSSPPPATPHLELMDLCVTSEAEVFEATDLPSDTSLQSSRIKRAGSDFDLESLLLPPKGLVKPLPSNSSFPPPQHIIAFPMSFGFGVGGPSKETQKTASNTTNPNDRSLAIDPVLSSVRSSADQKTAEAEQSGELPDIHFTMDETLDSATNDPASAAALEAALAQANNVDMDDGMGDTSLDASHLGVPDGGKKDQPFSRSPELRVSHKLAERKRRKEMKDLFDELGQLLPADRGSKSSKYEVLTRAIEYLNQVKTANSDLYRENEKLKRELDVARGGTGTYAPGYQPYNLGSYQPGTYTTGAQGTGDGAGATTVNGQQNGDTGAKKETAQVNAALPTAS